MSRTRLSFVYLISYLSVGGVGLLLAPAMALRLLGSKGDYSLPLAQFIGAFMVALAIIVAQIARHRVEVLYPTILMVRVVLEATIAWLYVTTRDPLFIVLLLIVGFGMLLTGMGLMADRARLRAA